MDIEDEATLLKVERYYLQRPKGGENAGESFQIEVYEAISPDITDPFIARPVQPLPVTPCKEEFQVQRATKEEALQECLNRLRGKTHDEVFPKYRAAGETTT